MPRLLAALSAALILSAPAFAELSPQEVGTIQAEQKAARAKVLAAHGNKSEKDMTPEERAEVGQQESRADLQVLQKHGVSDKDYTRYTARMDRSDQAAAKDAETRAEKAAQKPAAQAKKANGEVQIQRGVDEQHPLEIKVANKQNGVQIDRGVPASELEGQGEAPAPSRHRSSASHHVRRRSKRHHHRR